MTALLLETKLYAPQVSRGVIARPRLGERLARAVTTPVTLVSAPAGFGKTTLLAGLAADAAASGAVAWLSVDRADNDAGVTNQHSFYALRLSGIPEPGLLGMLTLPAVLVIRRRTARF